MKADQKVTASLVEVGFTAFKAGMLDSAKSIFTSIETIDPDSAAGRIGLASVSIANGKIDEAVAYLDNIAFSNKKNAHEAKKLLLVAAMLNGDQEKSEKVHRSLALDRENPANTERKKEAQSFFLNPSKR